MWVNTEHGLEQYLPFDLCTATRQRAASVPMFIKQVKNSLFFDELQFGTFICHFFSFFCSMKRNSFLVCSFVRSFCLTKKSLSSYLVASNESRSDWLVLWSLTAKLDGGHPRAAAGKKPSVSYWRDEKSGPRAARQDKTRGDEKRRGREGGIRGGLRVK